jgi:hypothetical protein
MVSESDASELLEQNREGMAVIRILHNMSNCADIWAIDFMHNNIMVASYLTYPNYTSYVPVKAGRMPFSILDAESKNLIKDGYLTTIEGGVYTIIINGDSALTMKPSIYFDELESNPGARKCAVRFIHGIHGADQINIGTKNGNLFTGVDYSTETSYALIPIMEPVELIISIKDVNILELPFYPRNGMIATLVLSGNLESSLMAILSIDKIHEVCEQNWSHEKLNHRWYIQNKEPNFDIVFDITSLHTNLKIVMSYYQDHKLMETIMGYTSTIPKTAFIPILFENDIVVDYIVHKLTPTGALIGTADRSFYHILSKTPHMERSERRKFTQLAKYLGY